MATEQVKLSDVPKILFEKPRGYFRKIDPTVQAFDTLTFPSINCSIPQIDKIVPDKGKTIIGAEFTENVPITGNKEKFTNLGGEELEVRVWRSVTTPAMGDVIEVLHDGAWLQITENTNPLPLGVHRFSFDDWWDYNLDPSQSKNLSRLIWVNGYEDPSTKKGLIFSWTGGIVEIVSHTGTTLTIAAGTTWRSYGFTEDAAGDAYVVVNGVSYTLVDSADLDTDTIDVSSTIGVSDGDIAVSRIETDESSLPLDICLENKGYMFYGNWKFRKIFMSNGLNYPATAVVTSSQAFQDDLLIPDTSSFTGTGSHVYKITIDSVTPAVNEEVYVGTGANDGSFDTSGYSGTGRNVYKVSIVADLGIVFAGSPTGWIVGEVVVGGTSGATARVFSPDAGGSDIFLISMTGVFQVGEVVTGQSSGTFGTTFFVGYQALVQTFKNGVAFTPPFFSPFVAYQMLVDTYALVDGITFTAGTTNIGDYWTTHAVGDYFKLTIQEELPDTFVWQKDRGTASAPTAITGSAQALSDGVEIQFINTTGHALGDTWSITVDQMVSRAWTDFYSTIPDRKPGQGHIFQLPSNFWTMGVQEEQVYVNTVYGQWSVVKTELSGDLKSEAISLTPLKQASANKVIDPWLIGHMENDLVYVTVDKNLDYIGRLQLYELPQSANLSDPVKLDFLECTFVGGGIKYIGKRLYIFSPAEQIAHCYDKLNAYWQPPKVFPEIGMPSIVGNELITHSNTRNQSFTMFTGASDNGNAYAVRIRTPYTNGGNRWKSKNTSMSFIEGYITGNPTITHRLYLGVNGCAGIFPHTVEPPNICIPPSRAPFGEGSFGSHSNGSDVFTSGAYFQEIWKKYAPILQWYFLAHEIECISKNHTWAILSLGINAVESNAGNNTLVNLTNLVGDDEEDD